MNLVTREVAEQELNDWLDYKKIKPGIRESVVNKEGVDTIIECICDGTLVLDHDKMVFTHKLLFEVGTVTELRYKPRINDTMVKAHMKGVKQGDSDGRYTAFICAVTDQPSSIIDKLDSTDKRIASSIVNFFI